MTTAKPRFHSIKVTGDADGNVLVDIDMYRERRRDVTKDPRFLGDPPEKTPGGGCSRCKRRWIGHYLDGVSVSARVAHRFDVPLGGFYSDECGEVQA